MITDLLPGFQSAQDDVPPVVAIPSTVAEGDDATPDLKSEMVQPSRESFSAFAIRASAFTRLLPAGRHAEIARRPRFRNQPYLRPANEPDDDFLP